MSERRYKRTRRIKWRNGHTNRLREWLGDPKFCVGWDNQAKNPDGTRGCWVFARMALRQIAQKYGVKESVTAEEVPVIWQHWVDHDTGHALSIDDPRLLDHLMKCDTRRNPGAVEKRLVEIWKAEDKAEDDAVKEMVDAAAEFKPMFRRMADDAGWSWTSQSNRDWKKKHFRAGMNRWAGFGAT